MATELSHDAFGRFSIMRRNEYFTRTAECDWCGRPGRTTSKGYKLFQYGYQADSLASKTDWEKKYFCSKPCHDAYYV